ncbi:transglutaminase domain-containing protein [Lacinutrix iliipiscaria]|uniref:Transglutaminase domain-containing protein n=1 Tax=Lacinutrix iliipiscaria TaxID=1230532 RepID=A0ABW5WKL5_9FLAO
MKKIFLFISILIINSSNAQVSDFKTIDFTRADNIAKLNEGAPLNNLPLLVHNLTFNLPTKVEKFRAIYSWVCNNIKGDASQDHKVEKKLIKLKNDSLAYIKWSNQYKKVAFKKLVKHKKTMCTGYAYLIKELCFLANIDCEIVNGYGRTVNSNIEKLELANHSWNAVKLNNKWYLCDATWSSGYSTETDDFVQDYNDGYFLTDPVLFAQSHYPIQKKWLLDEALINTEFVASPIVYGETFLHKIIPISPKELNSSATTNEEINFSFKPLKQTSLGQIALIQYLGIKEISLKIYDLKTEHGIISFKHQFKHKGLYDVHLKIGNDIVATYTINVTKDKRQLLVLN